MKKFSILLVTALGFGSLFSCQQKSEEQIKKEVAAEYQHKMDSMKLAEAQAKIDQLESDKQTASAQQATPVSQSAPAKEQTAPVSNSSTFSPEFSWLSERRVTEADLAGLSSWEKSIYRNAIYAMHGRKFVKAEYRKYFSQFSWYVPRYDEVQLSKLEQQNVAFIKSRE